jgi:hypothetical protein
MGSRLLERNRQSTNERRCRNAVAFACLQDLLFAERYLQTCHKRVIRPISGKQVSMSGLA